MSKITIKVHLFFISLIIQVHLVGSEFGAIWEDPEGGFIKFTVKRALKEDQTLRMEGKLDVILYFREECCVFLKVENSLLEIYSNLNFSKFLLSKLHSEISS